MPVAKHHRLLFVGAAAASGIPVFGILSDLATLQAYPVGNIVLAVTFLLSGFALLLAAVATPTDPHPKRRLLTAMTWGAFVGGAGYVCISIGIALNPHSNIPGLVGLLAAPFYWTSIVVLMACDLAWIVTRSKVLVSRFQRRSTQ